MLKHKLESWNRTRCGEGKLESWNRTRCGEGEWKQFIGNLADSIGPKM